MPAPAQLGTAAPDEPLMELGVLSWRYDCLVGAGYPVDVALELGARQDIDLHDAVDLLYRGCPVEQAVRILT